MQYFERLASDEGANEMASAGPDETVHHGLTATLIEAGMRWTLDWV